MTDTRSPEQRRSIMQAVNTVNTGPELLVRKLLSSAGYRYRLHGKKLPGKPDVIFVSRKKVIFIHGCFWHAHGCSKGQPPKSKPDYWIPKLEANASRDKRNQKDLAALGWKTLVVWQCELKDLGFLKTKLIGFLDS